MHWKTTTVLVCAYGIVKKFRPATPFLTPYLVSPIKNFTHVQLYSEIYPVWTYSYLIALIPIFFLTDLLKYKPIVMLEATSLFATWAILIWGTTLWQMQIMQICFGISSASEIAYNSYMYAVVERKHYKLVTSYVRAATLVGKFFAYGLGQLLVSIGTDYSSYLLLNQISLGSVSLILVIAAVLPAIPDATTIANPSKTGSTKGINRDYENGNTHPASNTSDERIALKPKPDRPENGIKVYFQTIWDHFQIFRHNRIVLKWSIWWALTSCGIFQVMNYVQTLWATMQTDKNTYNGITECANTLIGAVITFSVQYMSANWARRGEQILFATSALIGVLLVILSQTNIALIAYAIYVAIIAIYHLLITAASANIASQLDSASYGLVFGWNTFLALFLQTILTLVVTDKRGLSLAIRTQFLVYAGYFAVIAAIFALIVLVKLFDKPDQSSRSISVQSSRNEANIEKSG